MGTLTLTAVYPEADFQVAVIIANVIGGRIIYAPADMRLKDETEKGFAPAYAKSPGYVILVISPTMQKGFVDYAFRAR